MEEAKWVVRILSCRETYGEAFALDVSSWPPYCFLADWLTSDINCHPTSLPGTYGKGLTVRDCKDVTSVECKVPEDCRIEVAPLQPMQHGHAERGRRFALQSA
jgi:hypothetical protein